MSKLSFAGRVAVVTGAGTGLGREYALLLASRGAQVVVNDLGSNRHGDGQSKQAEVIVKAIKDQGGLAIASYDSVTEGEKIIQTALNAFGRIDILINNAGILRDRSFPRISRQDWDLVHDVHLKGSFLTTQAAWPIFKKQNFGRIVMTSSSSGICGNFGQTNYSAAKLGLIGMANTLALEGAKYNIHCNVIVPTAASRLTQDILPEDLLKGLDPKLIAPIVAFLCHESNNDNGVVIESGAGWAAKHHFVRSPGSILRSSIKDDVTIEQVKDAWPQINDMSEAVPVGTATDVSMNLLKILEKLKGPANKNVIETKFKFNAKDAALYALGIGSTVHQTADLQYVFEGHSEFSPLPTFFVLPSLGIATNIDFFKSILPHANLQTKDFLHGEHYLEIVDKIPTEGSFTTKNYVVDVMDKHSGAVVAINCDTYDESGKLVIKNQITSFIMGAGNFNGNLEASKDVKLIVPVPARAPDTSIELKTSPDQAALYRLSGDFNVMHIDPEMSKLVGQPIPILQGLCTLGFSMRAVLKMYANNDAARFKSIKARFSKPVVPGQTLKVEMWKNENRIHFRTSVVETGAAVILGAYVDLREAEDSKSSEFSTILQSDKVFKRMAKQIAQNIDEVKKVNAVFEFQITVNGKVSNTWIIDLKAGTVLKNAVNTGSKMDATIRISDSLMVDLIAGKVDVQVAFLNGDIKITGNIMATQKLLPLIKN